MKKHVYLLIAIAIVAFELVTVVTVLVYEDVNEGQVLNASMVPF